jgi:hypothetical protein
MQLPDDNISAALLTFLDYELSGLGADPRRWQGRETVVRFPALMIPFRIVISKIFSQCVT